MFRDKNDYEDTLGLPFKASPRKDPNEKVEEKFSEDKFRGISRPNLYALFDNIFKIVDKKILITSEEDIKVWEDDVDDKIEKSILMLDGFLENIVLYKEYISSQLKKHYYKNKLETLFITDVNSYMMSEHWSSEESFKSDEERFKYEDYVDLNEFSIYQVLIKKNSSKFLLILTPSFKSHRQNQGIFDKKSEFSTYYRLDLTKEYKEYYKL